MVLLSSAIALLFVVSPRADPRAIPVEVATVFGLVLAGIVINLLTATSVRTAVGPNGVAVRFGVFGWPRVTYQVAAIRHAEVIDLPWWAVAFGFWWTPRRTCCTVRRGPTLRLTLTNSRTVTITVPDPQAAAAALALAQARHR
jgi:uncharacterized protein YhhL (DUF1145 family)